jgi:hypothetical protein
MFYFNYSALSAKCYHCDNADGNCNIGEEDCTAALMDTCMKTIKGNAVTKACSTEPGCNLDKDLCKNSGKCEVFCCKGDLCNESVYLKPMVLVTILSLLVVVAQYLM